MGIGLIDQTYDMNKYHLFKNNKSILEETSINNLKKAIKENIKPPKSDTKVFVINFSIRPENKFPLKIVCGQYTLTDKLALVMIDDDTSITITWTKDELKKFGFKKNHISKIIKAIKLDLVSYEDFHDSITHVLDVTK
jgi:hypothetical protein